MFQNCSETSDSAKPVTAHSIQRIRALFDREKSDSQHQSHQQQHYVYPHQTAAAGTSGGIQLKPAVVSGNHQKPNDPQYYSPAAVCDRGDDLITDSHVSSGDTPVASDSIKEGWLNCKISNIDGKVGI